MSASWCGIATLAHKTARSVRPRRVIGLSRGRIGIAAAGQAIHRGRRVVAQASGSRSPRRQPSAGRSGRVTSGSRSSSLSPTSLRRTVEGQPGVATLRNDHLEAVLADLSAVDHPGPSGAAILKDPVPYRIDGHQVELRRGHGALLAVSSTNRSANGNINGRIGMSWSIGWHLSLRVAQVSLRFHLPAGHSSPCNLRLAPRRSSGDVRALVLAGRARREWASVLTPLRCVDRLLFTIHS